jgi:hypothetical protein
MIVVLTLFLGAASAKPAGDATVTYSIGWNPELIPTGGQVEVLLTNTGAIAIAKFALAISGGTVIHFTNMILIALQTNTNHLRDCIC